MNKYNLLSVLFLFACSTKEDQATLASHPPNEYLTIIVHNETAYPLRITTEASYIKPVDYDRISYQRLDTLQLPLLPFEEISFSHKGAIAEKTFAGRGDTLVLYSSKDKIQYQINHWNASIDAALAAYTEFQESDDMQYIDQQMDSIRSVFYPLDKSRPHYLSSDYEKMVGYTFIDYDESRFVTQRDLLDEYYHLVSEKYGKSCSFLEQMGDKAPGDFITALISIAERDYFDEIMLFNNLSSPAYEPDLMKRMNAEFYLRDDILLHPYAKKFLSHYMQYQVASPKKGRSNTGSGSFYSASYDIAEQHVADTDVLKYIHYLCITGMAEQQESFKSIEERYRQFKAAYQDQRFNEILENRYLFDFERYTQLTDDLKLIDGKREVASLNELLKNARGKLLYIDFWASWCAPCRAAMPASRQLKKDYEYKGVIFVYLSTDQDIDAWRQAVKAEKLDNFTFNYLIVNQKSSDFIKQIHLTTIPRYLLFDQQGVLVHQNAPGPDQPEVRVLLDEYLK